MNLLPGEPFKKAREKYITLGSLAMTAEDHGVMGSTPADKLAANPGKTRAELMSDQEILEYLRKQKRSIEGYPTEKCKGNSVIQSFLTIRARNLKISVEYLRGIGRLPEEFVNFSQESVEN